MIKIQKIRIFDDVYACRNKHTSSTQIYVILLCCFCLRSFWILIVDSHVEIELNTFL